MGTGTEIWQRMLNRKLNGRGPEHYNKYDYHLEQREDLER